MLNVSFNFHKFNSLKISMGHNYQYRCENCGYQEGFNQGHGYLVHSRGLTDYLNLNVKLFHYKTHNRLIELAKTDTNLLVKAGFEIYKCPRCKILFDKVEVVVSSGKKELHKSEFRCNSCGMRLKRTNIHRLKTATCPVCYQKTFHIGHSQDTLWH